MVAERGQAAHVPSFLWGDAGNREREGGGVILSCYGKVVDKELEEIKRKRW